MLSVAIVYEDDKPIRAFVGEACIYNAYKWSHYRFCLYDYDPKLPLHQLPDWLKVKYFLMSEEELSQLVSQ